MSSDEQSLLNLAMQHQQAGQGAQAEAICRQLVESYPHYADAWNFLGAIAYQTNRAALALDCFERAVAAAPNNAGYRSNHGALLHGLGRHAEAEQEFREAVRLDPSLPEAHNNLGNALRGSGKLEEAVSCYDQVLRLRPTYAEAYCNLGSTLRDLGRFDESIIGYLRAIELRPDFTEAYNDLGTTYWFMSRFEEAAAYYRHALKLRPDYAEAHSNLGNVLRNFGEFPEAVAHCRRAIELRPNFIEALNNLGNAYQENKQFEESAAAYRHVLTLRPDFVEALSNLGNVLRSLGRLEESEACCRRSMELRPSYAAAHNNLGNALREQGRYEEATACYRRALELIPDNAEFHGNLAIALLVQGDYEHGWPEYEWRLKIKKTEVLPTYPQPMWDGSDLSGRTILLYTEQGFGDTIHFIRFAALLKERGARVLFHSPKPLLPVLRSCAGIDEFIPDDEPPPAFDVHSPLMSLAGRLGIRVATIPATTPYLFAEPDLVRTWRERLAVAQGLKVGIAWQGNPNYPRDQQRSVPLALFEPLSRIPGVELFSLQVGRGHEQLAANRFRVTDLGSHFEQTSFRDAAAVMTNLDVLITVDTAQAHLGGALGVPTWMLLPHAPDWRWLLNRDDSPWYPSVRLFRQATAGDWDEVLERLCRELKSMLAD